MRQRRETVEHPFGTMKARMGATHFLTKTLPKVAAEMVLSGHEHRRGQAVDRCDRDLRYARVLAARAHIRKVVFTRPRPTADGQRYLNGLVIEVFFQAPSGELAILLRPTLGDASLSCLTLTQSKHACQPI